MKAAKIYDKLDVRIEDAPRHEPRPDEVQIKVKYCGLCGSDLHAYLQGWGLPKQPHPITGRQVPITLGHEFSGQVVQVGAKVTRFKVGDRIAVEPLISCGKCENCRKGQYNLCDNVLAPDGAGNFLGFSANGGFTEYANIKEFFAHKLPEDMGYDLGALAEPTAVVYEALRKSQLQSGENVAVMGAGPIGLLTALLAKISGASHVFIVDVSEVRLAKARELGLKEAYNPTKVDVVKQIRSLLPEGVDIAYEAAGVQATFDTALKLIKRGGILQVIALFGHPITINLTDDLIMQGIDIITTIAYNNSFEAVLGILDNHQDLFRRIITKKILLKDLVKEGIDAIAHDKTQVKILVSPEN